jgi:hypothetical protein
MKKCVLAFHAVCLLVLLASLPVFAQVSYTTEHNDNQRTGANLSETVLNQSNVNVNTFGMLFKLHVDDQVYATPLYVPNLTINGATHNVVFVATVNNTVYAFDADTAGAALWSRNFGTPTNHTVVGQGGCGAGNYNDFQGNIGIVGTPVIDTSSDMMFFVTHTQSGTTHTQTLHAISILTGADRSPNGSVVVSASGFNSTTNNQRPAITLSNGTLYIAWSSYCDTAPYHGFVMAYSEATLAQDAVRNDTSTGTLGGIWQAGQGLDVDSSGNLYVMTGNGTWDGSANFGESFLKLNPSSLAVEDYFTPSDFGTLNNGDVDLGAAGPLLIPGTNLIVGGGKAGIFYLLNTNSMGHETGGDTGVVQEFQVSFAGGGCGNAFIHGSPVYYNSSSLGPLIYIWGQNDFLHEFKFNGSTFPSTSPFKNSSMRAATCGEPGVFLSVSANGNNDSTAIVWGNATLSGDANHGTVPGIIRAFPATDVSTELWDSQQNAGRDSCNNFAKDAYPVVANGKLYVASFGTANAGSGQICVYGLVAPPPPCAGIICINSGGPAVSPFVADEDFTGGGTINHANTINTSKVTNPAPAAVYQTARVAATAGAGTTFSYTIGGFTAGTNYLVRLHFAETFHTTAGSRVFNVSINGTQVLTNFDIFATAGGENIANIQQFTEPANASGQFVILFTTDVDKALISGIEIDTTSGGSCTAAPTAPSNLGATAISSSQINLSWTASTAGTGCSISYSVFRSTTNGFTPSSSNQIATGLTATSFSDTGLTASTTYYYLVEGVDSAGSSTQSNQASATTSPLSGSCTSLCINSGGPAVTPFVADEDFTGGGTINHANTINTSNVTNPAPAAVYQTARVTATAGAGTTFSYTIGGFTANSSHTVRLHFAETFHTTAGSRVFNVSINGTQVLTNFDIFATAGGENIANIQQFTENANASGQYVLVFTTDTDKALISGIEID